MSLEVQNRNLQMFFEIEIYSTMIFAIEDLWGNMIGLPNDGYVVIKAMCLKTLCVDGNGKR